jgi:hypothetical protein
MGLDGQNVSRCWKMLHPLSLGKSRVKIAPSKLGNLSSRHRRSSYQNVSRAVISNTHKWRASVIGGRQHLIKKLAVPRSPSRQQEGV